MFSHVWKLVENSFIEGEDIADFIADILVDASVDETYEHIPSAGVFPIFKNDIGMPMRLPENKSLDNIAISSGTGAGKHDELAAIEATDYNL
jgi:hypothetical protein